MPAAIPGNYIAGGFSFPTAPPAAGDPVTDPSQNRAVIDGTPARVAALGLAAMAVLVGLRWSGIRFNITTSN